MGDPYYRYPAAAAAADRGSIPMPSFPGYFSSEAPSLLSHRADMHVASSDIQNRDISQMQPGMYGANDISNSGVYPEPNLGGLSAGASVRAYPSSLGDPSLGGQRWHAPVGISSSAGVYPQPSLGGVSARPPMMEVPNLSGHRWDASSSGFHPEPSIGDVSAEANIKGYPSPQKHSTLVDQRTDGSLGTNSGIPNAFDEKTAPVRNGDVHTDAAGESNILFVDGLPTDCSRREVGHLFRPFAGFKDIKVIHKEPRRSGDRAMVLCFVEFDDSKCAMTAMGSLQGYIFDDKKPDSPALRIQFAHFPFHFPADRNDELRANRRNDQRL